MPVKYTKSEALVSECGFYRYWLSREWDPAKATLRFIMLNPSTADWREDDSTIRKCVGFADRNNYGAILVMNLFALRSTKPTGLLDHIDPVGPRNDNWIRSLATNEASPIVCAWGDPSNARVKRLTLDRMPVMRALLGEHAVYCLSLTKHQMPSHPLMLSYKHKPRLWRLDGESCQHLPEIR